MDRKIKELREDLRTAERAVESIAREIAMEEARCVHDWVEENDHIHTKGYQIRGDMPGTMGVDFRGPQWVPGSTIKQ